MAARQNASTKVPPNDSTSKSGRVSVTAAVANMAARTPAIADPISHFRGSSAERRSIRFVRIKTGAAAAMVMRIVEIIVVYLWFSRIF